MRADEERNWAILAHLSALLAALVALAFLGPLVVLLIFGNRSRYVRNHAVEALNFQVTALLLGIAEILATGGWRAVAHHRDLTSRDRATTAVR